MLKEGDLRLITYLRKNARQTLTEISRKTRIPISTLYDKLRSHEGNVITKHTTLLDFAKLGFTCRANLLLRSSRDDREKLAGYLKAHPAVNNLFKINNGYDYMAETIFTNVKELDDFMDELESKFKLDEKQMHYIIDDIKREEFMPFIQS
jgi:DNA-binding Lrp family transcriptional regulator